MWTPAILYKEYYRKDNGAIVAVAQFANFNNAPGTIVNMPLIRAFQSARANAASNSGIPEELIAANDISEETFEMSNAQQEFYDFYMQVEVNS